MCWHSLAWRAVAWRGASWARLTSASVAAPTANGRRRAQSEVTWSGAAVARAVWHGECESAVKCAPSGGAFGIGHWRGVGAGRIGGAAYSLVGGQQRSNHAMNEASSRRRTRRIFSRHHPAELACICVRLCCWRRTPPPQQDIVAVWQCIIQVQSDEQGVLCGGVSVRAAARLNECGLPLSGVASRGRGGVQARRMRVAWLLFWSTWLEESLGILCVSPSV